MNPNPLEWTEIAVYHSALDTVPAQDTKQWFAMLQPR